MSGITGLIHRNHNNTLHGAAEWECLETWVAAVTEIRLAAFQALPMDLHFMI